MSDTARELPEGCVEVESTTQLREIVGEPSFRSRTKERPRLAEMDRRWLAASPFCLVATADVDGKCEVSPKGDPPGFTKVLDDTTIVIPERPGNKRVDGLRNIVANPHVGLIYFIPGRGDTLRVNGTARILTDGPFFDDLTVKGHRPKLAVLVQIETVFHHCAKAFMRSSLWKPDTWDPDVLPSRARIVKAVEDVPDTLEQLESHYGTKYQAGLYG